MTTSESWMSPGFEGCLQAEQQTTTPCCPSDEDPRNLDQLAEWNYVTSETFLWLGEESFDHLEAWSWEGRTEEELLLEAASTHSRAAEAQTASEKPPVNPTSSALQTPYPLSNSSPPTRTTECPICRQVFRGGDELEMHAIHERHRSFSCTVTGCDKRFFRRDMRTRHVAAHDASKHVCRVCKTKFGRRDHLQRHIRVQHPDEMSSSEARTPGFTDVDIKKVKESEPALRRSLSPDNLAIKMLDIANQFGSTEVGAQKAFACVVAHAALNAPEPLTPRTKRRLLSVQTEPVFELQDLDLVGSLRVAQ